jgi:hypothetical protein
VCAGPAAEGHAASASHETSVFAAARDDEATTCAPSKTLCSGGGGGGGGGGDDEQGAARRASPRAEAAIAGATVGVAQSAKADGAAR